MTYRVASACLGLLASLLLGACSVDPDSANIRVVEIIESQAATDAYLDDVQITTGGGYEYVGPLTAAPVGDQSLSLRSSDGTSNLLTEQIDLVIDTQSALVLAGSTASPKLFVIDESAFGPGSGLARLQVINTVNDGPNYDVFVSAADVDIATVSPTIADTSTGSTSSTTDFSIGTYRIRITTGPARELVYDSGSPASVSFLNGSVNSLVIYNGASATLTKALHLSGASTDSANTTTSRLTRFRMINATNTADPATTLNLAESGNLIFAGLGSSDVSSYQARTADAITSFALEANDATNTQYGNFDLALQSGEDHTILAVGTDPNLSLNLIKDTNTKPRVGFANLRVINAVSDGGDADVFVNFSLNFEAIAQGSASSSYFEYAPATDYDFGVRHANGSALINLGQFELETDRVYSLVVYGSVAAPQAVLKTDR